MFSTFVEFMAAETPLDVLSHAVSLVETGGNQMDDCRDSPSKELPTKELKYRRLKDRRELSTNMLPLRVWNRKCSSPQQILSPDGEVRNGQCYNTSPVMMSPCKNSENSPTLVMSPLHCETCMLHKPDGSALPPCGHCRLPPHLTERLDRDVTCINLAACDSDDDDSNEPLDMSKKCARQDDEPISGNSHPIQQQRPSVITCASALLRSQCHTKSNCQSAHCNGNSEGKTNEKNESDGGEDIRPGHRREVLSGMCDPVIDEHFRRSLGKDYPEFLFSTHSTSVSITVDDHFAKALGDTWLRLQQTKTSSVENGTDSKNKKASRSPPSSPVRSHSQGVVSL
ncbi:uncharacterized protein LOC111623527 isoform X3 [Centruroides sculpturatus]|uniref:uncharacterized protein LOC111623527 isoform X3 n=1 Tax=Centruroides sculpturatus TaxID=218467 RepID=UPI000C6EB1B8|nr:uncharacterized protein LOC111623527 isoform X3 [Centruroides sculpturatus]